MGCSHSDRLPDTWFKETKREGRVPKKEYQKYIPRQLWVHHDGKVERGAIAASNQTAISGWFVPQPFKVCLNCGIVHTHKKNEYTKLSRLSSEGRSTATTLLCLSTVSRLKQDPSVDEKSSKILSFTDNRQDASLQAGHFNDFVQTSFLRAALNKALKEEGALRHDNLAAAVVKVMNVTQGDYAKEEVDIS